MTTVDASAEEHLPAEHDLSLLCVALAGALNETIRTQIAGDGYGDTRDTHGYVFQHLLDGPLPIGELAGRLGVTQQAVSKVTTELEGLGYVRRVADPSDQRLRRVQLTDRAWGAIRAARRARRQLNEDLRHHVGDERWDDLLDTLRDLADHAGATDALRTRNLRQPP